MKGLTGLKRVVCIMCALLISSNCIAALELYTELDVRTGSASPDAYYEYNDSSTTLNRLENGDQYQSPQIRPSVYGYATHGQIGARTTVEASDPGGPTRYSAGARVETQFYDTFDINSPFVEILAPGIATATIHFHAGWFADDLGVSDFSSFNAESSLNFSVVVNSAGAGAFYFAQFAQGNMHAPEVNRRLTVYDGSAGDYEFISENTGLAGYPINKTFEVEFPFQFGQPNDILMSLRISSTAGANFVGDFVQLITDAGNTASWGGISNVRLLDGTPVTDFTALSSQSGADYSQAISAVPIPSLLWGFVVIVVPLLARRRAGSVTPLD